MLEFPLDRKGAAKYPGQLVLLLERAFAQEGGAAFAALTVSHDPKANVVRISGLDRLEPAEAGRISHRARVVFNEFMTSPWY